MLTCICEVGKGDEGKGEEEGDPARHGVDTILQYVRAELGDTDLQKALKAIYSSFQGSQTDHTTVERQSITRLFHGLRCVLLLHSRGFCTARSGACESKIDCQNFGIVLSVAGNTAKITI